MKYKITSPRMKWAEGSIVDESDLAAANVDALLEAGHIKKTMKPDKPVIEDKQEEPAHGPDRSY